jgi:ATP-dependent DNA ligase
MAPCGSDDRPQAPGASHAILGARIRSLALLASRHHYHPAMFMGVLPAGFVAPCLPTRASEPPSGPLWVHEIKHDGFRVIARKKSALYSRPGNDLTYRFPLIVETLARLRSRSCIIEGKAVGCDDNGVASSIAFATAAMTKAFSCTPST